MKIGGDVGTTVGACPYGDSIWPQNVPIGFVQPQISRNTS
jgi:hypothetical protein